MGKTFRAVQFNHPNGEEKTVNISGTRFCLQKSSAPEILMDFGDGFVRIPRGGAVRLPMGVGQIKVKPIDGVPIRGEIVGGDGEVDFAGLERPVKMASLHYSYTNVTTTVIDQSLNTHGMTLHFAHLRSTSDSPYLYLTNPIFTLMHANGGNRFSPAPLEVPPDVGLILHNTTSTYVTTSVSYELH